MRNMVQHTTQQSQESDFAAREGSPENPYPLHWPESWYKRAGRGLGFDFTIEEIREAKRNGGVLGVRQYEPADDALVELRIPEGSYVKCHVH